MVVIVIKTGKLNKKYDFTRLNLTFSFGYAIMIKKYSRKYATYV